MPRKLRLERRVHSEILQCKVAILLRRVSDTNVSDTNVSDTKGFRFILRDCTDSHVTVSSRHSPIFTEVTRPFTPTERPTNCASLAFAIISATGRRTSLVCRRHQTSVAPIDFSKPYVPEVRASLV